MKARDEKREEMVSVKGGLDKEKEKQVKLQGELEHIRSLQPKVRWACSEGEDGPVVRERVGL